MVYLVTTRVAPVADLGRKSIVDTSALRSELAERVDGEVRFDSGARAVYAQDASNYRQVPIGVVVPRTVDAAVAAIAVCRDHDAPILSRRRHEPGRPVL
jgi:hypothetical protein